MIPEKNIFWTEICEQHALVELKGNIYVVNGEAVAYWTGQEARKAQRKLEELVQKSRERGIQAIMKLREHTGEVEGNAEDVQRNIESLPVSLTIPEKENS